MGDTKNETMLEAIASRLAALEERNATLEAEVMTLRAQRLPRAATPRTAEGNGQSPERGGTTSRRMLLKRVAGAAVATVTAGALVGRETDTAAANHGGTGNIVADQVAAHYVSVDNPGEGGALFGKTTSATFSALRGVNTSSGTGVYGDSASGTGVMGESVNRVGTGVLGWGANGVVGESRAAGYAANYGNHKGEGYGVVGDVTGNPGTSGGVLGRNYGTGAAVWGQSVNKNGDGVRGEGKQGVHGLSGVANANAVWGQASGSARGVAGTSPGGYGGYFQGGKAAIRLVAANPTLRTTGAHAAGELFFGTDGKLWFCTKGSTATTAAVWKQLA